MGIVDSLRKFNKETTDLDEMIALEAIGKVVVAGYPTHSIAPPEWLTSTLTTLNHEITGKTKDQLEKRKRELIAQRSGLESAEEKRQRIAKEIAEIDAKLGVATTTA